MVDYVYRDGSRLTPYMFYQIERLNFDLKKLFGVEVFVTSGIRLPQEQIDIFLKRYVTAGEINGRKVYDTRVWRGTRYYRISRLGTVAVPGTSNHEIQGSNAAVDIRDTGSGPGIATAGSARANWLRANCHKYDMVAEGYNFREPWHYKTLNIFNAVPGGGGGGTTPTSSKDDDDMVQSVKINGKIYGVKDEFISHYKNPAEANITRQVMSSSDELHDLGSGAKALDQFVSLLDGLGIPRDVLDNSGYVKNPQSGKFENGGVWSRDRENAARLDRLLAK